MNSEMLVRNARIVTRQEVIRGSMRVRDGRIDALNAGGLEWRRAEDWDGDYLLPGLVELHTDNLEKHLTPRPGVHWPALPAVLAHDAQLAAAGITTVLDAIALGDVKPGGTRTEHVQSMIAATSEARRLGLLRAEHLLHLRCELSTAGLPRLFESLLESPGLALVSLMDHTPGQRQFLEMDKYREYYKGKYGLSDTEMDSFTHTQLANRDRYSAPNRRAIVALCRGRGIALASHDDATPEHVGEAVEDGVAISEFPTTMLAARTAHDERLGIVMGAPNVVRGGSHSGNVSALELARERLLDGLSSDYVPASLLHAAFLLNEHAGWGIAHAVACVSSNPARMAGLDDRGEIAPRRRADFIRVRIEGRVPVVLGVWRQGHRIL